jgi:hypothetical protein
MGMKDTFRARMHRLATSRRGRIPLAVIGVLLLLTSVMVIGTMETREEPTTDVDASVVINQTEAAAQTAIRDGTQRGAETAAERPLTTPADNAWGEVLNGTDRQPTIHPTYAEETLPNSTFVNYLKALVYLEVQSNLKDTGMEKDGVQTAVTLPAIEDETTFGHAVDNITVRESEPGLLDVTIENVTITATHDGRVLEERTQTMTVSVATPVMQLHRRVSAYQDALNAGVMERGFSQRFNARTYAIGWARGYAQNYRLPVVEVMANRHIEPSANSALYRTQQDIFGAADPALQRSVRLGWLCMAIKDGAGMFDQYTDDGVSYRNVSLEDGELFLNRTDGNGTAVDVPDGVESVADLCNHAEWLLGDQVTGALPDAPSVTDLLGEAPGMNANETVDVGKRAYVPLARMTERGHEHSFESAIQRLFTVDAAVHTTGTHGLPDDPTYSGDCANGSTGPWQTVAQDELAVIVTSRKKLDPADSGEQYYRYRFKLRAKFEGQKPCLDDPPVTDTSEWQLSETLTTVVTELEANPNAKIDRINPETGIETKYERGGPPVPQFRNYDGVQQTVTKRLLGESDASVGSFNNWAEKQQYNVLEDDLSETFSTTGTVELDHHEFLDTALAGKLAADIAEIQAKVTEISHTFARTDYIERGAESPFAGLMNRVNETMREAYLEREQPYESVGQKTIYEARYAYWRTLLRQLAVLRGAHAEGVASMEDELNDASASIDDALTYLQQGVSGTQPEPVPLESPPVTDDITYEVSGSPTYLVGETLTNDDVPAIQDGTEVSALAMKNREYIDLPYETAIDGLLQWVANKVSGAVPGLDWGSPDPTISFRMAGDVLMAGELATATDDIDGRLAHDESYDQATLEQKLHTFESNVEGGIEQFKFEMALRTATELYPEHSEVVRCLGYAPSGDVCDLILGETDTAVTDRISTAIDAVEGATDRALEAYDDALVNPTASKAVALGNGSASALIRDNVTDALDEEQFYSQRFAGNYSEKQWEQVVDSAARPAYEQAASMRVEIGDGPEDAEWIDNSLQTALGDVTGDLIEDRLDTAGDEIDEQIDDIVDAELQDWAGKWSGTQKRPARVPAGLPLLPLPGYWYATVNAWDINVGGEYARFEATANMGTPETVTETTYVRENLTVEYEIAGERRTLGAVEPIGFQGRSLLVVVTPPGVGVGDRDDVNPECSENFPIVGPIEGRDPDCTGELFDIEWTEQIQETD